MRSFPEKMTALNIHKPQPMKRKTYHSKTYMIRAILVACAITALASCSKPSGISRVWAIDDGEKIKQEDINNPLANDENNNVWKNNTVNIFGGRNEIVAFQLIIQADVSGAQNVNVMISDLVNGNSVIPGSAKGPSDPFDYRGRNTELFTEHYLNMIKRSPPLWFFSDSCNSFGLLYGMGPGLSDSVCSSSRKRRRTILH